MTVELIKLVLALLLFGTAGVSMVVFFLLPSADGAGKHTAKRHAAPRLRVVKTHPNPLDNRAA